MDRQADRQMHELFEQCLLTRALEVYVEMLSNQHADSTLTGESAGGSLPRLSH